MNKMKLKPSFRCALFGHRVRLIESRRFILNKEGTRTEEYNEYLCACGHTFLFKVDAELEL